MADAPKVDSTCKSSGSPAGRPVDAHVAVRATPPPLPPRRSPRPPPLPGTHGRPHHPASLGPGGVPRRLLKDVLTLPPVPTQDVERFFWPAETPARAHPVIPPAPVRRTHHWVLAGLALSVSGAFAAGLWAGRVVERHKLEEASRPALQAEAPVDVPALELPFEVAPPLLATALVPAPVLLAPQGAPAVAGLAPRTRAETETEARPWELAGVGGVDLLQLRDEARPSPLLSPEDTPAAVRRLADAPFESPLAPAQEEDREVAELMDTLPGLSPSPRRLSVEKAPSVWLPPAPATRELPERLSRDEVLAVLLAHKDELVECVREQQARRPDLHGTMVVRWNIRPAGATTGIVVESPEMRDTALARCAKRRIGAWTFPAHRQQMGPVRVPFTF